MKELNELNDRMDGMDELVDSIIKKLDIIEKKDLKPADYTVHFEALKQIFEVFMLRYNKESVALMEAVSGLNVEYPASKIQNNLAELKTIVEAVKKELPIKVRHKLDAKTKSWVIVGTLLLIATSISIGLSGRLWIENNRLQADNIKYRLIRQLDTIITKWADSLYNTNPDQAEKIANKLESEQVKLHESKSQKKPNTKRLNKRRIKFGIILSPR